MNTKILSIAVGLSSFLSGTFGGGNGPLEISKTHGLVQIKPLGTCTFRTQFGSPEKALAKVWQTARKGQYMGVFLLRTANGAWAHLNGKSGCVDGHSLLEIDSAADVDIKVVQGGISSVDGRKGLP